MDRCDYCQHPLKPVLDEHGDQVLKHGLEVVGCKSGHWFVLMTSNYIDRPQTEAVIAQKAA